MTQCVTIITVSALCTCISFCIYFKICYSAARLRISKCEIKLSASASVIRVDEREVSLIRDFVETLVHAVIVM